WKNPRGWWKRYEHFFGHYGSESHSATDSWEEVGKKPETSGAGLSRGEWDFREGVFRQQAGQYPLNQMSCVYGIKDSRLRPLRCCPFHFFKSLFEKATLHLVCH